ncbi:hypothetical protein V5O48_018113 [Marasmius crinis-equi]|uniref:F-box domain-containing protein n=1 Tax=Marasmius crinis-equi TaxID=585013 RepID=A0ABR3EMA5_9AGAR
MAAKETAGTAGILDTTVARIMAATTTNAKIRAMAVATDMEDKVMVTAGMAAKQGGAKTRATVVDTAMDTEATADTVITEDLTTKGTAVITEAAAGDMGTKGFSSARLLALALRTRPECNAELRAAAPTVPSAQTTWTASSTLTLQDKSLEAIPKPAMHDIPTEILTRILLISIGAHKPTVDSRTCAPLSMKMELLEKELEDEEIEDEEIEDDEDEKEDLTKYEDHPPFQPWALSPLFILTKVCRKWTAITRSLPVWQVILVRHGEGSYDIELKEQTQNHFLQQCVNLAKNEGRPLKLYVSVYSDIQSPSRPTERVQFESPALQYIIDSPCSIQLFSYRSEFTSSPDLARCVLRLLDSRREQLEELSVDLWEVNYADVNLNYVTGLLNLLARFSALKSLCLGLGKWRWFMPRTGLLRPVKTDWAAVLKNKLSPDLFGRLTKIDLLCSPAVALMILHLCTRAQTVNLMLRNDEKMPTAVTAFTLSSAKTFAVTMEPNVPCGILFERLSCPGLQHIDIYFPMHSLVSENIQRLRLFVSRVERRLEGYVYLWNGDKSELADFTSKGLVVQTQ